MFPTLDLVPLPRPNLTFSESSPVGHEGAMECFGTLPARLA